MAHPLTILRFIAGAAAAHKVVQAVTDEVFDTTEFPRWFRHELIDEHVEQYGEYCPMCDCDVDEVDLTVDHIVALRNGGRTSRANAQVICRWCNSSKGARNTFLDYLRGR